MTPPTQIPPAVADLLPVIAYQAMLPDFDTTFAGAAAIARLGFTGEEFLGETWKDHLHEDDRERVERELDAAIASKDGFRIEYRFWNKARSSLFWFEDRGLIERNAEGVAVQLHGVMIDISGERAVFQASPVPMWVFDLETLRFLLVNEAAVSHYGYSREEFLAMTLEDIRPREELERFHGEVSKRPQGLYDAGVWRHRRKDGSLIDVRIFSHDFPLGGRPAELILSLDVTRENAAEQRAMDAEAQLKRALTDTVHALVSAVEGRDAYTAGHQRRVARLARAVGEWLGLEPGHVEGLELAALVHDVGKVSIPAEIMALPRAFTLVERRLMQQHCEAGRSLLAGIRFPWPIADAVHQHHERLDGSGYPQGLRGEDIHREALIIGACDVVEAMSSHRPWRPALGIGAALEELARGRGTLYDPRVVDAFASLNERGLLEPLLEPSRD